MTAIVKRLNSAPAPKPGVLPAASDYLQAADRIGRQLCRDAIWAGERCNWLGWSLEPVGGTFRPVYRALGPGLYSGVAGVALFLAELCRYTRDRQQEAVRDGAIRQMLSRRAQLEALPFMGHYAGLAGVGHTLTRLGELTGDERLVETGLDILGAPDAVRPGPAQLDIVSGAAGAIPALIDAAQRYHRHALLEKAVRHGELLLRTVVETQEGSSWPTLDGCHRNLLGLSHGTAGIACALLELHRVHADARLLATARDALRYERHHFQPKQGNWPDFRTFPGTPPSQPQFMVAWCHGAGGIGLSRLRMLELLPGETGLLSELDVAQRTASAWLAMPHMPGTGDFTLCHGMAGNADFLLQVGMHFQRPDIHQNAERVGQLGIEVYQRANLPWPCGVPGAGETPGLMVGTAGIGHFFLRLHEPERVPSVLYVKPSLTS